MVEIKKPLLLIFHYEKIKGHWKSLYRCGYCNSEFSAHKFDVDSRERISCGCMKREFKKKINPRQGIRYNPRRLYRIWMNMRHRCHNPNTNCFSNYMGKGITICKEWNDYEVFYNWAMANGYKDDLMIDRINVDGNYEPSNCRWVTHQESGQNTSRTWSVEEVKNISTYPF